jgi:hypothetical protein
VSTPVSHFWQLVLLLIFSQCIPPSGSPGDTIRINLSQMIERAELYVWVDQGSLCLHRCNETYRCLSDWSHFWVDVCRFHRHCVGLSAEQVEHLDRYICPTCAPESVKKSNGTSHRTPDTKVTPCILQTVFFVFIITTAKVDTYNKAFINLQLSSALNNRGHRSDIRILAGMLFSSSSCPDARDIALFFRWTHGIFSGALMMSFVSSCYLCSLSQNVRGGDLNSSLGPSSGSKSILFRPSLSR